MKVALARYDAARRALAAAHRVDEVKAIRDKAEAVRVYARQAGDFELQNKAAEIRLLAERRAGQLLVDMQVSGERQAKERGRPKKVSSPTTLPKLGITRDQSSKWQRLAMLVDDATFERALTQARERDGELTTAGLLRAIRETVTPVATVVEPDINVVAAELIRDLESASRREKMERVARLRNRLNPTIRKKLILALKNSLKYAGESEAHLSKDFKDYPANGKAFQRVIRERMAEQPDPLLREKTALAADFKNATVREISLADARNLIVAQEWLGNLGSSEHAFGLFFGDHLAGCVCFGSTAGTKVKASVCGTEHAEKVTTLTRGCCLHWSHPHSGSFLVSAACREMTKKGYHIFIAYADPQAGERGVILRASNFLYCGPTSPTEKFRRPDGKVYDARNVHLLTRDRRFGMLRYKRSRAEQKQILIQQGCEFFKDSGCKHRFVGIFGDRRTKKVLRAALRWQVMEYPKQAPSPEDRVQIVDLDPVPKTYAAHGAI
ncbi:MAG TPA: hypothetical protein VMI10_12845 [Terriglobales bacterium]|nr:hypothetical protein [Terriglobales bacterium]